MGWVRVDDAFYDHEKFYCVNALGLGCWIAGLAWANRNLSNGFIPYRVVQGLVSTDGLGIYTSNFTGDDAAPHHGVEQLVAAGLWEQVSGGYQIHDYLDYQPSADDVKAERKRNADRKAAWRASHNGSPAASHGGTTAETPSPVTAPPNPNPNPNKPKAAARASARKRRRRDIGEDLQPLIDALARNGISVSCDAEPHDLDVIRAAVERCGIPALVKHATSRWRKDDPAFSIRAFVAGWESLAGPAPKLELVAEPCEHGEMFRQKCALCRNEAAAS